MSGNASHAQQLATRIDGPREAAIDQSGAVAAVAGMVGTAASAAPDQPPTGDQIEVRRRGWLAVGPRSFLLVGGGWLVRDPGAPFAEIDYGDVAAVELRQGRLTTRAQIALADGRGITFETQRNGAGPTSHQALELLAERCA